MKIKLKISSKPLSDLFTIILFVFVIFTPDIKFLPKLTWILSVIGALTLFNNRFRKSVGFNSRLNEQFIIMLFFSIMILSMPPFIHGTGDVSYINLLIGIILTLFRNYLLIYLLYKQYKEDLFVKFCDFFIYACIVCVAFTILFIIFPEFKTFWLNSVLNNVTEYTYYKYEFRYSISGPAAFTYTSIFSIAAIVSGYMIIYENKLSFKRVAEFIIISIGCSFYGRTALIGVLLSLFIIIFSKGYWMKTLKIILFISITAILLNSLLNFLSSQNENFAVWRNWAFDILNQIFIDKNVTDYSVTHLFNDMYFKLDLKTLFIGDGYYTDPTTGRYYMSTDSGYMRLLLYSGIIGLLTAFSIPLYLFKIIKKFSSRFNSVLLFMVLLIIWLVLEIKGEMYHRIIMMIYPMFLTLQYDYNKNKTINNTN